MECPRYVEREGQAGSHLVPARGRVWVFGLSAASLMLIRAYRPQGGSIIPDSVTLQYDPDSMMMKSDSYEVWTGSAYG